HPLICRTWDIDAAVGFEVDAAPLLAAATLGEEDFEDLTTFPAIRQDLAVVAPTEVSAAEIRATVVEGGGELLQSGELFDRYEGAQVGEGKVSLALRLEFRAPDRTLADEEVSGLRAAIATGLEGIGAQIRGAGGESGGSADE